MDLNHEKSPAPIFAAQCDLLSQPGSGRSLTVLLVEDEAFVRKAAAETLAAAGYNVIVATNAEEAVEICRQRSQPIDVLLADLIMPGMSGRELASEFRKLFPDSSVLLTTGYAEKIPDEHSTNGYIYLAKPFSASMLLQKLGDLVQTKQFDPTH